MPAHGWPACYSGTYRPAIKYRAGEIVVSPGSLHAWMSKIDFNETPPPSLEVAGVTTSWVSLGEMGPTATRVAHSWHPADLQYPLGDGIGMSQIARVCSDCWKDAAFRNAFDPLVHLYIIREQVLPL